MIQISLSFISVSPTCLVFIPSEFSCFVFMAAVYDDDDDARQQIRKVL